MSTPRTRTNRARVPTQSSELSGTVQDTRENVAQLENETKLIAELNELKLKENQLKNDIVKRQCEHALKTKETEVELMSRVSEFNQRYQAIELDLFKKSMRSLTRTNSGSTIPDEWFRLHGL